MEMAVTIAIVPGVVDVDAGLRELQRLDDQDLLALAPMGLLGWGWSTPSSPERSVPWADDTDLMTLMATGVLPPGAETRYLSAVRLSIARCLNHVTALIGGEDRWFDSRIATRIPLVDGGQMVLCPEDLSTGGQASEFCDVLRLPVEILPVLGRSMGVFGPDGVGLCANRSHSDVVGD